MAYKGKFRPLNPKKYKGDPTNIIYRSGWERTLMSYLDRSPNVIQWASEENIILYRDPFNPDKIRRYFMDFWIKQKSDTGTEEILVEVKPHKNTLPPKKPKGKRGQILKEAVTYEINTAKWKAAEIYAAKKGYRFIIATEKTVNQIWKEVRFI